MKITEQKEKLLICHRKYLGCSKGVMESKIENYLKKPGDSRGWKGKDGTQLITIDKEKK